MMMTATQPARVKPHRYEADPRDTTRIPACTCGMTKAYRGHQPWWWRWLNPRVMWR